MLDGFLAITAGALMALYRVLLRALWRDLRSHSRHQRALDEARRLLGS